MELNRDQIIKALECCAKGDCDNCPCSFGDCYYYLARDALALIRDLTEENERMGKQLFEVFRAHDESQRDCSYATERERKNNG